MSPRKCIFCNEPLSGVRAKEHAVPQWLLRHLGMTDAQLYNVVMKAADNSVTKARTTSAANFVEGRICRGCNNGWMQFLEDQAKPILTPLIEGDASLFSINRDQRTILARWAIKTAYVLSYTSTLGKTPDPMHLRFLMKHPYVLPQGVGAFAQQISTGRDFAAIQRNAWPRLVMQDDTLVNKRPPNTRPPEASYKIALEFRHLMVLVAFWPGASEHYLLAVGVHVPLWPVREWYPAYYTQSEVPEQGEPDFWLNRFSSSLGIISEARNSNGQNAQQAGPV